MSRTSASLLSRVMDDTAIGAILGFLSASAAAVAAFFTFRTRRLDAQESLTDTPLGRVATLEGALSREQAAREAEARGAEARETQERELRERERLDQLHRELALGRQLFDLQSSVHQLTRELEAKQVQISQLQAENADLRWKNTDLQDAIARLRAEVHGRISEPPTAPHRKLTP